jgi:hypothetical protein
MGKRGMFRSAIAIFAALAVFAAWPAPARAQDRLPIFDAHVHYSRPAWKVYDVDAIFRALDAAGVARALVSSSPDEGTLRLYEHDRERIVPILRPYRDDVGPGNWFRDAGVLAYLAERLRLGVHKGIGEIHLSEASDVRSIVVRETAVLAEARGLPLHVHAGAKPTAALFNFRSRLSIIWGHAGLGETPQTIDDMLERFPNLTAELALRAGEISPGGTIDPAWRDVLIRHQDRFMIGSDTWVTPRWGSYPEIIDEHRRWLAQLPGGVARKIAYGNAVRLFGAGKGTGLSE